MWAGLKRFLSTPEGRRRVGLVALLVCVVIGIAGYTSFRIRLAALRSRHATGPGWAFPSRVYSDGVALVPGRPMPHDYLEAQLAVREYRALPDGSDANTPGTYTWIDGNVIEIALRGFLDARDPEGFGGPERVRVTLDRAAIARVERLGAPPAGPARSRPAVPDTLHAPRLEPFPIAQIAGAREVRRTWVPLSRIPKSLQDAVVATEDRRFRHHFGLDLKGNARAILRNWRAGEVREGASTITQQLARGLFLGRERTFGRKIREAVYAVALETALSKDSILEMYLNSVYWGQGEGRGVAGAAEAANWYFDAPVESLSVSDAALLAGIIPSPVNYSPFRDPRAALKRRNSALADMVEAGVLDAKTGARLRARPLHVRRGTTRTDRDPSFVDFSGTYLEHHLPAGASTSWGLTILTTCDLVWQRQAELALGAGVDGFDPAGVTREGARKPTRMEGAFVALDPRTAEVRAIVGGRAQIEGDFDRATVARRQTGSSIKPLIYAAALETKRGDSLWTAASTVGNLRRTFETDAGPWTPENSDGSYSERITLARALARSVNVATANIVEEITPQFAAKVCERFGLGKLKPVASIGLGTNEVTLLDLVNAYTVFPAAGVRREARPVRAVLDAAGTNLLSPPPRPTRVLKPTTAAIMVGLLEDVVMFGISHPLVGAYGFARPVGGKTGTTNDFKDAWFVGFTPDVVAGVWMGYDTPRSLGRTAAGVALPVWARIMTKLMQGFPPTPFPEVKDVDERWIDGGNGLLSRADCPSPLIVPFAKGTEPRLYCAVDHTEEWAQLALKQLMADSAFAARESLDALGGTLRPSRADTIRHVPFAPIPSGP